MISQVTIIKDEQLSIMTDGARIQQGLSRRIDSLIVASGEMLLPCAPALLDDYMKRLDTLFATLGKPFSKADLEQLRKVLASKLEEGFRASPHSRLVIQYHSERFPLYPVTRIALTVKTSISTLEQQYQNWVERREPPLFGTNPDAKVMIMARQLGNPNTTPILDIGAGTGRNTLPLARLGYPVHALELTPPFVLQLLASVNAERLPVIVTHGDVLDLATELAVGHYRLAIAAEVVSHFRSVEQLHQLLARMCQVLRPGGFLLFNCFVAIEGYDPDKVAREISQVMWSCIFTQSDLAAAAAGLPLQLVSDESVYEYERTHLPAEAWPPTGWFTTWTQGQDVIPILPEKPPLELRWLLYRRL